MPELRVERVPVAAMGLGLFGFDHLQIVYRPSGTERPQSSWFVVEGLRDTGPSGTELAVEGWHGATTLAEANGAVGRELEQIIGTPETRGSRVLASGAEAVQAWSTIISHAADFERQRFPYQAYSLPGSVAPTLNSSSLVGSLLHHAGFDVPASMPHGLRLSPGLATLLGTSGGDTLSTGHGFTSILAGGGRDKLHGTSERDAVDRLYGGDDDDLFHWSAGFNIVHGGQPGRSYAADGNDTLDYSGAIDVIIESNPAAAEHSEPDFIVHVPGGRDHLFSIEDLVWDGRNDHVTIGRGAGLIRKTLMLKLEGGDDEVDAHQAEIETFIDGGPGRDTIHAGPGPLTAMGGPGADTFVISGRSADLVILDGDPEDHVRVSWPIARVETISDESQPDDLVLKVIARGGRTGIIRAKNFENGDLGFDNRDAVTIARELDADRECLEDERAFLFSPEPGHYHGGGETACPGAPFAPELTSFAGEGPIAAAPVDFSMHVIPDLDYGQP